MIFIAKASRQYLRFYCLLLGYLVSLFVLVSVRKCDASRSSPCAREPALLSEIHITHSGNIFTPTFPGFGDEMQILPNRFGCSALESLATSQVRPCLNISTLHNALVFTPFSRYFNMFHLIFDDLFAIWFTQRRYHAVDFRYIITTRSVSSLELEALHIVIGKPVRTLAADLGPARINRALIGIDSQYDTLSRVSIMSRLTPPQREALPFKYNSLLLPFAQYVSHRIQNAPAKYDVVWLARGASKRRQITNEIEAASAVAAWSEQRGYHFLFTDNLELSFSDQVAQVEGARIIIGAHGAALALLLFSHAANGTVFELFPPGFWRSTYQELAQNVGLRHVSLWGTSHTSHHQIERNYDTIRDSYFEAPIDSILTQLNSDWGL